MQLMTYISANIVYGGYKISQYKRREETENIHTVKRKNSLSSGGPFLSSPFSQQSIQPICPTLLLLARLLRITRDNLNLVRSDTRTLPLPRLELEGNILNQEGPDLVAETIGIQVTLKTYIQTQTNRKRLAHHLSFVFWSCGSGPGR